MSGEGAETTWSSWDVIPRVADGLFSVSAVVAYTAMGAVVTVGRGLLDAVAGVVWRETEVQPHRESEAAVRHTLRIAKGEVDGARPFEGVAGATHLIVYDPETPHAGAALAHEFAHVLLAVVRGGPAE